MSVFARTRIPILILALVAAPLFAHADLININTADAALLDTLPGIGPSKAQAIIDYRTQYGPFARIEDIQNVSGIGASTYAQIEPYITVGTASSGSATSTDAAPIPAPPAYVPPPSALSIDIGADRTTYLDVPTAFSAELDATGTLDSAARVLWSFGDGSAGEGLSIEKTYRFPGTYLVTATALDGQARARSEATITVLPLRLRIAGVTGEGVIIANDTDSRMDISGWRLAAGTGAFRMPVGTTLLPGASVLFPFSVTNLPVAYDAVLYFPDGIRAAAYAPPRTPEVAAIDLQLSSPVAGSVSVQSSSPLITSDISDPHASEAISAPAATAELAAAGAALDESSARTPYWLYGLVGIALLAGGVFVFL